MTDELRDHTTPRAWSRADTDALLDAALARTCWACEGNGYISSLPGYTFQCTVCEGSGLADSAGVAFLPPTTEETERRRAQTQPGTAPLTQAQLDKAFEELRTWNGFYA